jgi:hypothetical protein
MQPSVIVWDLETVPDLLGFAAANDLVAKRCASETCCPEPHEYLRLAASLASLTDSWRPGRGSRDGEVMRPMIEPNWLKKRTLHARR